MIRTLPTTARSRRRMRRHADVVTGAVAAFHAYCGLPSEQATRIPVDVVDRVQLATVGQWGSRPAQARRDAACLQEWVEGLRLDAPSPGRR